jgi:hypothetical protein
MSATQLRTPPRSRRELWWADDEHVTNLVSALLADVNAPP